MARTVAGWPAGSLLAARPWALDGGRVGRGAATDLDHVAGRCPVAAAGVRSCGTAIWRAGQPQRPGERLDDIVAAD